jgi:hypothetical protein
MTNVHSLHTQLYKVHRVHAHGSHRPVMRASLISPSVSETAALGISDLVTRPRHATTPGPTPRDTLLARRGARLIVPSPLDSQPHTSD